MLIESAFINSLYEASFTKIFNVFNNNRIRTPRFNSETNTCNFNCLTQIFSYQATHNNW